MNCLELIKRYATLKAQRDALWLPLWRDVRRYTFPSVSDYLVEGGVRGETLLDDVAIEAGNRLSAGIINWMMPLGQRWAELQADDKELQKNEEVKAHFAETTKDITTTMANANWSTAAIQFADDLSRGLDGVVYIEEIDDGDINCRSFPIESIVYATNNRGEVDTVFREFEMTARQIVQQFDSGGDIPEAIRAEAQDAAKQDAKHKILHAVFARVKRDPCCIDNRNMPFADVYIEIASKNVLYESGFHEMPYAVCSFKKSNNESYGRGPGIDKLPSIKMLNRMREVYIVNGETIADPPWLIPDDSLVDRTFDKGPGGTIFYKPGVDGAKPEQLINRGNIGITAQDIEEERKGIRKAFHWDLFDPLADYRNITATEAEIRQNNAIIPFAPVAGNVTRFLSTVIHRVYAIRSRAGKLPELPPLLMENPDYKIEFVSKMALSLKKLEAIGWLQTEQALVGMVQLNPAIMDNFNTDDIARDMAIVQGASPAWLVPAKERDAIRAARAEQQAKQQQIEMMAQGATLAPDLAKAPEPGSPMDQLLSGQGV